MNILRRLRGGCLLLLFSCVGGQAQWTTIFQGFTPIAVSGSKYFALCDGLVASTDNGATWSTCGTLPPSGGHIFVVEGNNMAVAGFFNFAYSSDNGATWKKTGTPFGGNILAMAISGTNCFIGTYQHGVYKSTDNGANWSVAGDIKNISEGRFWAFAFNGSTVFVGGDAGVLRSTDHGQTWERKNSGLSFTVGCLVFSGNYFFAGTDFGGVCRSTDGGESWSAANAGLPSGASVTAIAASGSIVFAATNETLTSTATDLYVSTNNGATWSVAYRGFKQPTEWSVRLLVCGSNLIVCSGDGVYRRPVAELITSVSEASVEMPTSCVISQNYPNPFNPSTKIQFGIPNTSFVSLKVLNLLGAEVATLANENKAPGTYQVTWDASSYPSGVYFYRLQAGEFTQTKKLVLVR